MLRHKAWSAATTPVYAPYGMEINPEHEIVVKMGGRLKQDSSDPLLDVYANILYRYALLAEGSELDDSPKFNQALLRVLSKAI